MNYIMFLQKLKKKEKIPRLLLLVGGEGYLRESIITHLKEILLRQPDLNYQYLKEEALPELNEALSTYPFLDENRLIAYDWGRTGQDEKKEEKSLYELCSQPLETAYLLILVNKADKKSKLYQLINEQGMVVELFPLKNWELEKWLVQFWSAKGKSVDRTTVNYIIQILGNDLGIIIQEMNKLELYLGDKECLEKEDAEKVLGGQLERSLFKLCDLILDKKLDESLFYLREILALGQPPLLILAMIQRELRQYWQTKLLLQQGIAKGMIKKQLGIYFDFIIDKYERKKDNFQNEELESIWQELLKTDLALKNERENSLFLLEKLLIKIIIRA